MAKKSPVGVIKDKQLTKEIANLLQLKGNKTRIRKVKNGWTVDIRGRRKRR